MQADAAASESGAKDKGDDSQAVLSPVEKLGGQADLKIAWDESLPEPFRLREEAVLRADLTQLSDALNALDKQMAQKLATRKRLDMSIAFQQTLMNTLNQRVATRQEAIDLKVGTKINLYDAKEELEKSQSQLASDQGQLIETDAALTEVQSEKAKTISQFIADNENKLAEASRKADEARQSLAKAAARLARTKLYAPIDGVVQQTAVTTVGQVVTTGQQLAVITPHRRAAAGRGAGRQSRHRLRQARRRTPWSRSTPSPSPASECCTARSSRSPPAPSPNRRPSAPSPTPPPPPMSRRRQPTAPGQPESFVFPVTVALDETAMKIDNAIIPLTPGMTVTVEIKTDSRRVIDYLMSPLSRIASEAGRER